MNETHLWTISSCEIPLPHTELFKLNLSFSNVIYCFCVCECFGRTFLWVLAIRVVKDRRCFHHYLYIFIAHTNIQLLYETYLIPFLCCSIHFTTDKTMIDMLFLSIVYLNTTDKLKIWNSNASNHCERTDLDILCTIFWCYRHRIYSLYTLQCLQRLQMDDWQWKREYRIESNLSEF